jgi:hypothetical protein
MDSGHPLEATRVLTEHLQNLMKGAAAGLCVPAPVLETTTRYALRLHQWTQRAAWIDYVFELHLTSWQVPSELSLTELEATVTTATLFDTSMLDYFVKTLERRAEPLTMEETLRLKRLEHLGRV